MEFIITYIATIIFTYIIEKYRTNKFFKDIADNGYKIDIKRYKEYYNSDDKQSLNSIIFLIPFLNMFYSIYTYVDYINNKEINFNMLRVNDVIKQMNKQESYIYNKNPKSDMAIVISCGTKEKNNNLYKNTLAIEQAKQIKRFTKKLKRNEISQEELIINIMNYYHEKYPDIKDATEHIKNISAEEIIYIYNMCCKNEEDVEYIYDDKEYIEKEKVFSKVKKR